MTTQRKKPGRPRKKELEATKPGKVGRPPGTTAIINEYRDRMLASPKSRRVLDAIFDAALDNEHKAQAAAWKIIADRILPIAAFEQDLKKSGGKTGVTINITGIGDSVTIDGSEDNDDDSVIDGEVVSDANS